MAVATLGRAPDPVAVLRAHRSAVTAVAFHPASGCLLSGDADGELKLWDVVRRRPLSSARVHPPSAGVIGIGTSQSLGNKILSQGRDGTVKCWPLTSGGLPRQALLSFNTGSYHFCKLSVPKVIAEQGKEEPPAEKSALGNGSSNESANGFCGGGNALIAVAGEDPSTVEIWDVDQGKRVQQLRLQNDNDSDGDGFRTNPTKAGMCMALRAFHTEAGAPLKVVAGYENGSMATWDLRSAKRPLICSKFHSEPVISIDIDSSRASGVSGAADDKLIFFSTDDSEKVQHIQEEVVLGKPGVGDVAIRQDDRICATAGWDNRIRIYDFHQRRPLAVLKYHADAVTGVAFSEDQKLLASSSNDATIALWSIYPPKQGQGVLSMVT